MVAQFNRYANITSAMHKKSRSYEMLIGKKGGSQLAPPGTRYRGERFTRSNENAASLGSRARLPTNISGVCGVVS